MKRNSIKIAAKIISSIFSPLMMPTYGIIMTLNLTYLYDYTKLSTRLGITSIILLLTAIIPLVLIQSLSTFKYIKDTELSERADRTIPFIVTLLLYISSSVYLYFANAPIWIYGFMIGASTSLAIAMIVNRWWKISAHGTAVGGLVAIAIILAKMQSESLNLLWLVVGSILVAGMVGTSRLILKCHTPAQVYSGFVNGFINILFWTTL